jgi:rSAM/selenodomain-associated transferase 1
VTTLIILAKSPVPGQVKTRLCPPCTAPEAARIAGAALLDTLDVAASLRSVETALALDGPPGPWVPQGMRIVPQRGVGLDERIASAFVDVGGPALLIGMDTPQVSTALLRSAVDTLSRPGVDAVLGCAEDGGWWACGLREPNPDAFVGVPMSTPWTGAAQMRRLRDIGLSIAAIPAMRDVDTFEDALAVAGEAPDTRFARAVRGVTMQRAAGGGS